MSNKIRFCWHCSRKLQGNHYAEYKHPEDGHTRIVHKVCLKDLQLPVEHQRIVDLNHIDEEDLIGELSKSLEVGQIAGIEKGEALQMESPDAFDELLGNCEEVTFDAKHLKLNKMKEE